MKNKIFLTGVLSLCLTLSGCYEDNPSSEYPTGLIFQEVGIVIDDSSMKVFNQLSSNRNIYLSSTLEQQYLTVNNGEHHPLKSIREEGPFLDEEYITVIDIESFNPMVESGDEITVSYERADGQVLRSRGSVPEDLSYLSPINNSSYDHTIEDIIISWQPSKATLKYLYLAADCLDYGDSEYSFWRNYEINWFEQRTLTFPLDEAKTSFTIAANSLNFDSSTSTCEITVSLYPTLTGEVDNNLAGGTFSVRKKSSLTITLTNI